MVPRHLLLGLFLLLSLGTCAASVASADDSALQFEDSLDLTHLTDRAVAAWRQRHPESLVMFYAPWSGAFRNYRSVFSEAAAMAREHGSLPPFAAVDCTKHRKACAGQAEGYPTVRHFYAGSWEGEQFHGGATAASFIATLADRRQRAALKSARQDQEL